MAAKKKAAKKATKKATKKVAEAAAPGKAARKKASAPSRPAAAKGGRAASAALPARGGDKKKAKKKRATAVTKARKAVSRVGRENIRSGARIQILRTPWLTATRQGFTALERYIRTVERMSRRSERDFLTFDLYLKFRIPDGSEVQAEPVTNNVIRTLQDVRGLVKKGETLPHAWRYHLRHDIQGAMWRIFDDSPVASADAYRKFQSDPQAEPEAEMRKKLQAIKKSMGFRFRIAFHLNFP